MFSEPITERCCAKIIQSLNVLVFTILILRIFSLPSSVKNGFIMTRNSADSKSLLMSTDNSVGKLVYNWYAACMDEDERDKLGAGPLLELIHNTMGEQFNPFVPNDFSGEDWVLEDVLGIVHSSLNVFPFFTINLGIDPLNSSSPTHLSVRPDEVGFKSL